MPAAPLQFSAEQASARRRGWRHVILVTKPRDEFHHLLPRGDV